MENLGSKDRHLIVSLLNKKYERKQNYPFLILLKRTTKMTIPTLISWKEREYAISLKLRK